MRVCKNSTTDLIRKKYRANPVDVPDSRIQPYQLLIAGKRDYEIIGDIGYLFTESDVLAPVKSSRLADQTFERSERIDIRAGLKILDGFLKMMQIPSPVIGAAYEGVKEISFGFLDAERKYFEMTEFGSNLAVKNARISPDNPVRQYFNGNMKVCLITDILVSPQLRISAEVSENGAIDLKLPVLESHISELNLGVKVRHESNDSITFEGEEALTYAFSCIQIFCNPSTGKLSFGDFVKFKEYGAMRSKDADGLSEEDFESQKVILGDTETDDELLPVKFNIQLK